jgi:hypothetical protein
MIAQICGSDSVHDISIYHAAFVAQVIFTGTLLDRGPVEVLSLRESLRRRQAKFFLNGWKDWLVLADGGA